MTAVTYAIDDLENPKPVPSVKYGSLRPSTGMDVIVSLHAILPMSNRVSKE